MSASATSERLSRISVIVPVRDGAATLAECLQALHAAASPETEIIVVDDASSDGSAAIATAGEARVIRLTRNVGAGPARNAGAHVATGDVLVFVDADVVVAPDTLRRLATVLVAAPEIAAVFGSYDATPRAPELVSQYRNLLHHFVHQTGAPEAATFWAGCGAIRRLVFEAVGGFASSRRIPGVEDIELGYRLRAAGHRIRLAPEIQVTHLKRWTLASVIRTDALLRALPWSRLLVAGRAPLDHLNVGPAGRASVALAGLATGLLPLIPLVPGAGAIAAVATLGVVVLNRRFLAFLVRVRGFGLAAASVPLLVVHYVESGVCFAWAWLEHVLGATRRPRPV